MIRKFVPISVKGFTLVELLTVIFIISILAGIVIVNVNSARVKARDDKRKIDIDTVAQALELYYAQNKEYPYQAGMTDILDYQIYPSGWFRTKLVSNYISSLPIDPKSDGTIGIWPNDYDYLYASASAKKFVLDARLEKTQTNYDSTIVCNDSSNNAFWRSGIVKCGDDNFHYRRASQ